MTPKSMLRNELSVSSIADLTKGAFAAVIDEMDELAYLGAGATPGLLQRQGVLGSVEGTPQGKYPRCCAAAH